MIYRSNLTAPDLTPHFKHLISRPMPHSFGHDVPSDWGDKADDDPQFGLYKRCGMWTHDEAAILYNVARGRRHALDIGAHTGWTTAHMAAAHCSVTLVEPMHRLEVWQTRVERNLRAFWHGIFGISHSTADVFFESPDDWLPWNEWDLIVVDGDHLAPHPMRDAQNAAKHLVDTGVILLHDAMGKPVYDAAIWLMDQGFHCRIYWTPHVIACCWRGDFTPPEHVPDPELMKLKLWQRMPDFDFGRCK